MKMGVECSKTSMLKTDQTKSSLKKKKEEEENDSNKNHVIKLVHFWHKK